MYLLPLSLQPIRLLGSLRFMRCNRIDFSDRFDLCAAIESTFSDRFDLCAAIESTFWIAILKRLAYHKFLYILAAYISNRSLTLTLLPHNVHYFYLSHTRLPVHTHTHVRLSVNPHTTPAYCLSNATRTH